MNGYIMGMLAETSIHPGAGQVYSVIDLPVAREATTSYPTIPGSSLKGALRDKARQEKLEVNKIFGIEDSAGAVSVADARLLLLPIRSLTGHFRWVTCPYLINRFYRDCQLINKTGITIDKAPSSHEAVVASVRDQEEVLFLEEYSFKTKPDPELIEQVANNISFLIHHESVRNELKHRLVIIRDEDFSYFAQYGLPIQSRNRLDEETKKSIGLWQEETIPPDTVFYTLLMGRFGKERELKELVSFLSQSRYLQVGGNETIGQGWFVTEIF
ncbi:CRISPR-associated protein, Cmr4 family [Laceyella tengchongensis]|uniref:CRISPR-associated protein, Cmr4 family n=1 Tax=Laceyella tengchongensis TaxID=574699 RepID=A0AA45WPE7_9BACL|nr:type III-B CRISPR module RAMP protein Cmr4 [Laceyella tengchongensis]SMP21003.1 CRISPR-associated protein, Cmr4 family [Laceyella tengchongensis]